MIIAVPVALGIALFINFYAPRRAAATLGYFIDLLAAVPSIVFGLWGFAFLAPNLTGLTLWLDKWFGWIPIFDYQLDNKPNNLTVFTAGIILAIMILPIISSISREVFRQVPREQVEAALALGATRWEMIRTSVLPVRQGRRGVRLDPRLRPGARRDARGHHRAVQRLRRSAGTSPRPAA